MPNYDVVVVVVAVAVVAAAVVPAVPNYDVVVGDVGGSAAVMIFPFQILQLGTDLLLSGSFASMNRYCKYEQTCKNCNI